MTTITRKTQTGEPGNRGEFGTERKAESTAMLTADAFIDDPDTYDDTVWAKIFDSSAPDSYQHVRYHDSGADAEAKHFDREGRLFRHETFDDAGAAGHRGKPASDRRYAPGGIFQDSDDGTAAFRLWDHGVPQVVGYFQNGVQHDPGTGEPAETIYVEGGFQHTHYAHGIVQDPAHGVPARVRSIENGRMVQSKFVTQGQVWKETDDIGLDIGSVFGNVRAVSTRELA